ncbi:MAG: fibronectin type III domain-containing protein [Deltaproteobacteria bacterium]|nr:fibronectin type III domain-containing protein [Deltaproteobacteria bacterium]
MFQGFDSGNVTTVANNITFGGNNAYHSWDGATPTGSTVNRNNFYNISSTFAYMADGSYSLATWRSTFGYDVNSITDNPQFVGGSGVAAYKLQSGSPARTLGRTITAIHGSSGQTIPAGAYITGNEVIGLVSGAPSDTTPPSTPTNLTATAVSSSQINLSWTASTDNVGVSGYRIYRCQGTSCTADTQIATSSTNSYQDTGLAASTTYRYRLRAYDAAGNLSSYSSTASATTQDTTPPGAPIWGPNPIQRVD